MENINLTSPDSVTSYRVSKISFDWDKEKIVVVVIDNHNKDKTVIYSGPTAVTLMNLLNTVNLTNNSLHKRILNQLASDGYISAGTVTGSHD